MSAQSEGMRRYLSADENYGPSLFRLRLSIYCPPLSLLAGFFCLKYALNVVRHRGVEPRTYSLEGAALSG